ncbi:unnamed protein product [Camellia sinensis]
MQLVVWLIYMEKWTLEAKNLYDELLLNLYDGFILIYNINWLLNCFVEWCIIASGFVSIFEGY